jgi:hypothetical protein
MKLFEIKSEDPFITPRQIRVLTLRATYVQESEDDEADFYDEEEGDYDEDGYRGAGFELENYQYNSVAECFNNMEYAKNVFSTGWDGDNSNKVRTFINHHTDNHVGETDDFSDHAELPEDAIVDIGVFAKFSKGKQTFEWDVEDDAYITAFDGIDAREIYELALQFFKL